MTEPIYGEGKTEAQEVHDSHMVVVYMLIAALVGLFGFGACIAGMGI